MLKRSLEGCHILVVEDEYMLADELQAELSDLGATVLGPAGTIEDAIDLIGSEVRIDGAILDVNLRGEWAFPAADALTQRHVPYLFTTGYDQSAMPSRFTDIVLCEKPINIRRITEAIVRIVHGWAIVITIKLVVSSGPQPGGLLAALRCTFDRRTWKKRIVRRLDGRF